MTSSILLIIPYFGKFKNYFQLFLESCRVNSSINWLILTDDVRKFDYPKNVQSPRANAILAKMFEKFDSRC